MTKRLHPSDLPLGLLMAFLASALAGPLVGQNSPRVGDPLPGDLARGPVIRQLEGGLLLEFEIQGRPIAAMKDLKLIVTLSRQGEPVVDAEVTVDLAMPAMFMGKNTPVLVHVGGGRYEGKAVLPRCMSGDKRWRAEVRVKEVSSENKLIIPFETT